jgi:hypothetical protein
MTVTRRCGWRDSPFKIPIRRADVTIEAELAADRGPTDAELWS